MEKGVNILCGMGGAMNEPGLVFGIWKLDLHWCGFLPVSNIDQNLAPSRTAFTVQYMMSIVFSAKLKFEVSICSFNKIGSDKARVGFATL